MCGENLFGRFEDWMYKECDMKKQTTYNYKNLVKLMKIVPTDELHSKHDVFYNKP